VLPLWHAVQVETSDPDAALPYWAFAWGGGLAIARHLADHPELVAGRNVVDFASGSGLCAIAVGAFTVVPVFVVAMVAWGFSFWMGVPGAFSLLAERSAFPDERAGDAQAVMAAGRVVGPLVGGALYEVSPLVLGLCAGGVMVAASIALLYVEWRIRPSSMPSGLLTRRG